MQRFRFCGESDCPDWILAEINTLSRISSVKLKQLAQIVAKSLITRTFDVRIISYSKFLKENIILFTYFDVERKSREAFTGFETW